MARPLAPRGEGPPLRSKILGLLLIVGSFAVIAVCIALIIGGFARLVGSPIVSVPGEVTRTLGKGTYVVYERSGLSRGAVTTTGSTSLSTEQVSVTGANGDSVRVRSVIGSQSLGRNGVNYTGVAQFRVSKKGAFTVAIAGAKPTSVIITKGVFSLFRDGALGFLGVLGGVVMLIVGIVVLVRSGRPGTVAVVEPPVHLTAPAAQQPTPAGWYPAGPSGELRWWSGSHWTEDRAAPPTT